MVFLQMIAKYNELDNKNNENKPKILNLVIFFLKVESQQHFERKY